MNIRKSLILSHIVVWILPFFMTFFILASAFAGLMLYASSGNHVMAESGFQFNVISNAVRAVVFHGIRHRESPSSWGWVMEITDPLQNYVILEKNGTLIYQYGNEKYEAERQDILQRGIKENLALENGNRSYSLVDGLKYEYVYKEDIRGDTYFFYMLASHPVDRNDNAIEEAFRNMAKFIGIMLVIFIVLTSFFLSRFLIRRILSPLRKLKKGAEEIRKGNLSVHIDHGKDDEFKPAVDAFNLMAGRLKETLEEKERNEERRKELIAAISHDIRTPLTSIKAYVEGLLDHVASTPEMEERYLRVIQKKADVLDRLINQLFLLSKLDIGEKAVPLETLELSSSISRFVEENRLNWEKNGASFTLEGMDDFRVRANTLLLERIIENLVSNSIRYKKKNLVHITIRIEKKGDMAEVHVLDDGPGVPEEALSRLKEAFYRTDSARSATDSGSGLGLSIVYRAVKLMKGTLNFRNRKPEGLEAVFTLPMEEKHEEKNTDH